MTTLYRHHIGIQPSGPDRTWTRLDHLKAGTLDVGFAGVLISVSAYLGRLYDRYHGWYTSLLWLALVGELGALCALAAGILRFLHAALGTRVSKRPNHENPG